MLALFFLNPKEYFTAIEKKTPVRFVLYINLIYYFSFYFISFYDLEWPKEPVIFISNVHFAISLSIIIDMATNLLWSVIAICLSRAIGLEYSCRYFLLSIFSLNLLSLAFIYIEVLSFLSDLNIFSDIILGAEALTKFLYFYIMLASLSNLDKPQKLKTNLIFILTIVILFSISSLFYLLPKDDYIIRDIKITDEILLGKERSIHISSIIVYKTLKSKENMYVLESRAEDLIRDQFFILAYEKIIKLYASNKFPNKFKPELINSLKNQLNNAIRNERINIEVVELNLTGIEKSRGH